MRRLRLTASIALLVLMAGCSEMQQIPMNQAQTDTYNQCMSSHWSSLADSALFGVAGYEYHQNQVLNCQQVALTKGAAASAADPSAIKPVQSESASPTQGQIEPAAVAHPQP
jgi:hypothetical protein